NSLRCTHGRPVFALYLGRPSGPVEARTALVTSSETTSSALSATDGRSHSYITLRAWRRAHATPDGKAPRTSEVCSGKDARIWPACWPVMTTHPSCVEAGPTPGHCPVGFYLATEERPRFQRRSCACARALT